MDTNGDVGDTNGKNVEEQSKRSSRMRIKSAVSQCCAMVVPDLLSLSYGLSLGFATILIPELYKKDAEIVVSLEELTWISSMNYFSIPIGAVASGPIAEHLGRKRSLILSAIPYAAGWLSLSFSGSHVWMVFVGFALLGLAGGISLTTSQMYSAEISEPRIRGAMAATLSVGLMLGTFLPVLLGRYTYWRTLALINAAYPIIALLIGWIVLPEPPCWLASKGRLAEAERSLRRLRGWTDSNSVKPEFDILLQSVNSKDETSATQSNGELSVKRYFRREVVLPFFLSAFSLFLSGFNGCLALQIYAILVFKRLDSPIHEYTAAIILTGLQLVAVILLMLFIRKTGKRAPTLTSLGVTSVSFLIVGIYVILRERDIIQMDPRHSWVPTALILISVFVTTGGIKFTPWYLVGEVFPMDSRSNAVAVACAMYDLTAALASKTFLYKLDAFTMPGIFIFFSCVNLIGFIVLYWAMPETEGKTLAEIGKFFSRKPSKRSARADKSAYFNEGLDPR